LNIFGKTIKTFKDCREAGDIMLTAKEEVTNEINRG
jgi:hypothetical protein